MQKSEIKSLSVKVATLVLLGSIIGQANASFLNAPVPSNAYILKGGLDWAWASPLPASSSGFDLSYESQFGWRLPTTLELASAPLATDFLFAGANVPFNGTDPVSGATFSAVSADYTAAASAGAVATPYFNNVYHHADWQDGLGETFGPWAGMAGANSTADQLVVRTVPEPASLPLLALGGAGLLLRRRR